MTQLANVVSTRSNKVYKRVAESKDVKRNHVLMKVVVLRLGDMPQLKLPIVKQLLCTFVLNLNTDMSFLAFLRENDFMGIYEDILKRISNILC